MLHTQISTFLLPRVTEERYVASKHAVMGLTRTAALDYAKQGIRINAVNPGLIVTEMLDRFSHKD